VIADERADIFAHPLERKLLNHQPVVGGEMTFGIDRGTGEEAQVARAQLIVTTITFPFFTRGLSLTQNRKVFTASSAALRSPSLAWLLQGSSLRCLAAVPPFPSGKGGRGIGRRKPAFDFPSPLGRGKSTQSKKPQRH